MNNIFVEWLIGMALGIILGLVFIQLAGCGDTSLPGGGFTTSATCHVTTTSTGAVVTCPDGSTQTILNGQMGGVGANALVAIYPNDTQCGSAGGNLLLAGTDLNHNTTLDTNEVSASADICNGAVGQTGATGAQGQVGPAPIAPVFMPVAVVFPCGQNSSSYKEALLGLSGGGLFGEFSGSSDATTVRNTLIPDGSFYDTDNSQCIFAVSTDSSGNRSVTWTGSTENGSGPFGPGNATYISSTVTWTETYTAPGK